MNWEYFLLNLTKFTTYVVKGSYGNYGWRIFLSFLLSKCSLLTPFWSTFVAGHIKGMDYSFWDDHASWNNQKLRGWQVMINSRLTPFFFFSQLSILLLSHSHKRGKIHRQKHHEGMSQCLSSTHSYISTTSYSIWKQQGKEEISLTSSYSSSSRSTVQR